MSISDVSSLKQEALQPVTSSEKKTMEKKGQCSSLDRLSNLPDSIRSHIISFLPLKYAIRNTILSKGWKRICSSLTNLDFTQISERDDLEEIIDRILFLHVEQPIQKLKFCVRTGYGAVDPLHLNAWISFALRHNVVQLSLDLVEDPSGIMLPCSLFNCSTLVVLKLCWLDLNLPSKVHFPVLKTLKLTHITFHNEYLSGKLFSDCCCPTLLNLIILNCYLSFTTLSISSTSLNFFKLVRCDEYGDFNIKMSTPNLREIDCNSKNLPEFSSEALSSLVYGTFNLPYCTAMFPCSLFSSSTLLVLSLRFSDLKLPSRVHFPLLNTLILDHVSFNNECLTRKLFSDCCCPRLSNLNLRNCFLINFTTLSISLTSLNFLKLHSNHAVNLSTPNLHEINFGGKILPQLSSETLSSLFIGTFSLHSPYSSNPEDMKIQNLACKTLAELRNVDKLRLKGIFIKLLTRIQDISACLPTSCCGLKRLDLEVDSTKSELRLITFLCRCYPNLQHLLIHFYDHIPPEEDDAPQRQLGMEHCLQSKALSIQYILKNLRTVRIENYSGSEDEVDLVGHLLENANILERIDIQCLSLVRENVESGMRIRDILLALPRFSPSVRIYIS